MGTSHCFVVSVWFSIGRTPLAFYICYSICSKIGSGLLY